MGREDDHLRDAEGGADGRVDAPIPSPLPGPRWLAGLRKLARRLLVAPIGWYRRWISPLKPATCRFSPTCSAYAHEAILRHGVIKGVLLAIWRILRCQPFARGGYDPVPVEQRRKACPHDDAASPPPAPRRSPDPPRS